MNIQSIVFGVSYDDMSTVLLYVLTDNEVVHVEICERENVGLMGWWPVKGEILAKENAKELWDTICISSENCLDGVGVYDSLENFKEFYPKYAEVLEQMKVENDKVILPKLGGLEYGTITTQNGKVEMGKVQIPLDDNDVPF